MTSAAWSLVGFGAFVYVLARATVAAQDWCTRRSWELERRRRHYLGNETVERLKDGCD